jgi:hypothetical protein
MPLSHFEQLRTQVCKEYQASAAFGETFRKITDVNRTSYEIHQKKPFPEFSKLPKTPKPLVPKAV